MLLRERALRAQRAHNACRIPYTQNRGKMGNIQPYGRLKGRNHVGIYLFETINEQVFSASADCIENAAVRQSMQRHSFPVIENDATRYSPPAAKRRAIAPDSSCNNSQRKPRLEVPSAAIPRPPRPTPSPTCAKPSTSHHPRSTECIAERLAHKQAPYHPIQVYEPWHEPRMTLDERRLSKKQEAADKHRRPLENSLANSQR